MPPDRPTNRFEQPAGPVIDLAEHPPGVPRQTPASWIVALCLIAGTIALYRPSLSSPFVQLDDYMYVIDNDAVRIPSWESVRRICGEVLSPTTVDGYYQPLSMLSLMGDAWLAGGDGRDPFPYHLTNILWHALNGVLVFLLFRMLVGGTLAPIAIAVIFLVHPAQVESVSWISQRKSVMATFFSLASLMAYLEYGRTRRVSWFIGCWLAMLLANLAKPTAMPLPLVLILLDVWPLKRSWIRALPEKLAFLPLIIGAAYVSWVSQSTTAMLGAPKFGSFEMFAKWVGLLCYNLATYLGNLVWPFYLSPYREIPRDLSWMNPEIGASAALILGLVVIWILAFKRSKSFFVGSTAFILTLSPAMGGVHFASTCVGDRFLYLPMIFLLFPLAVLFSRWEARVANRRGSAFAAVGLVVVGLAFLTHHQQSVWGSSRNLWFHIHKSAPSLPKADYNVALYLLDDGRYAESLALAREVIAVEPGNAQYHLLVGRCSTRLNRAEEAGAAIERAIQLGLGDQTGFGWLSLAEVRIVTGDIAGARACAQRAAESGWTRGDTYAEVGDIARRIADNCDAAIEFHRLAVEFEPEDLELRYGLAQTLRECGHTREAIVEYEDFMRRARLVGLDVGAVLVAVEKLKATIAEEGRPE